MGWRHETQTRCAVAHPTEWNRDADFALHTVIATLLTCIHAFKVYGSTVNEVFVYFTTWSWTVLLVWMWWMLVAMMCPRIWTPVLATLYFLALGAVFEVFVLFSAVVWSNPQALLRFQGDNMSFGELFVGEKITHGGPVISMLAFSVMNAGVFRRHLHALYRRMWTTNPALFCALCAWWLLGALAMLGIYGSYHDAWATYKSRLTWTESFAIGLVTSVVVCGTAMWTLVFREPATS